MDEQRLHRHARRSYELARLRKALGWAVLVIPLAALSHTCCVAPITLWCMCAVAFASLVYGVWRGQALGAGARAGLVGGFASWLLPMSAQWSGLGFSSSVLVLCFLGGLASGLLVGWQLRHRRESRAAFLVVASVVAGLIGALGCVLAGAGGIAGMVAGELLGAAPLALAALRRPTPA